jgi:hypothetical protein
MKHQNASDKTGKYETLSARTRTTLRRVRRRRVALILVKVDAVCSADSINRRNSFAPRASRICIAILFCRVSRSTGVFQRPVGLGACIGVACGRGVGPRIPRRTIYLALINAIPVADRVCITCAFLRIFCACRVCVHVLRT